MFCSNPAPRSEPKEVLELTHDELVQALVTRHGLTEDKAKFQIKMMQTLRSRMRAGDVEYSLKEE